MCLIIGINIAQQLEWKGLDYVDVISPFSGQKRKAKKQHIWELPVGQTISFIYIIIIYHPKERPFGNRACCLSLCWHLSPKINHKTYCKYIFAPTPQWKLPRAVFDRQSKCWAKMPLQQLPSNKNVNKSEHRLQVNTVNVLTLVS